MEDPTISEGELNIVMQKVMERIKEGEEPQQIVIEIEREFEDSIHKARLKSASESTPSYFIMTINMNGPSSGSGTADKRRKLLKVIMRSFPSSIIFCQELPGRFDQEIVPEGCESVKNEREVAVIWGTEDFDGSSEGLKTTDREIREIRDKVGASELLSRMTMVKLTRRQEPAESILAISFHGRYNLEEKERNRVFQILLKFIREVIQKKGIRSYVIGGDFNFNTLEIDLPKDVAVQSYASSPRLQKKEDECVRFIPHKDNFFCYPYPNLKVSWVRPFQFGDDETAASDVTKGDQQELQKAMEEGAKASRATDMLDHDPVVAVLVFLPHRYATKAVKSLTKHFEKVSLSTEPKEQ